MDTSNVSFLRMIPDAPAPRRIDGASFGELSARAKKYCQPIRESTSNGWHVFLPCDIVLQWDGKEILWKHPTRSGWIKLGAVQYPNYRDYFNHSAPDELAGLSPPFLSSISEVGHLIVWTGFALHLASGYGALIRPCPNMVQRETHQILEGFVDHDKWQGPLQTVIRLLKTDRIITLSKNDPLFAVQIFSKAEYAASRAMTRGSELVELENFTDEHWSRYRASLFLDETRKKSSNAYVKLLKGQKD